MTFRPTAALVRALVLAGGLLLIGVVLQRADLLIFAVPFVLHAGWAGASRPGAGEVLRQQPTGRNAVREGHRIRLSAGVDAAAPRLLTVAWPTHHVATFVPATGAVTGLTGGPADVVVDAEPDSWGRCSLGTPTIAVHDASLAWRAQPDTEPVDLIVRPLGSRLEGPSGVTRPTGISGVHPSRRRGEGTDLADIRPFRPGDRMHRINWKVTARRGEVHVNATHTDRDTDVVIVADTLVVARSEHDQDTSLDLTARAISALAGHYVALGDRVSVIDMGRHLRPVPPGSGPTQLRRINDALARLDLDARRPEIPNRATGVRNGTLAFVCTPLLHPAGLAEILRLQALDAQIVVIDTLPDGFGDLDRGNADDSPWLTEAWALLKLERQVPVERLHRRGIPLAAWRGPDSLVRVLTQLERARSAPRRKSR